MIVGGASALGHRPAQPLLAAFSVVFLAAPQLVALAERAPAGLMAGAVFLTLRIWPWLHRANGQILVEA
jgi:hypothetical protein